MTNLRVIAHSVKKEFKRERCGCDYSPPDNFYKSQWQNRSKSIPYLIYRWIVALFFIAVVIESMINSTIISTFALYFIYLTNWGIMLCMVTNCLGAVLVTIWHYHPEYQGKLLNMHSITSPFRIYWLFHITTLVLSIVITIIYWSVLYDATVDGLHATNILTHAMNSILMFIDFLIVAHPIRLLHIFFPLLFGLTFTIFSVIYTKAGGVNAKGEPYIYNVLDWNNNLEMAILTNIGVLLLVCVVYVLLFLIYKLKIAIHRSLNKSSFFLPTTTTKDKNTSEKTNERSDKENGVQHSPSGISMALGNYAGYDNQAFTFNKENN